MVDYLKLPIAKNEIRTVIRGKKTIKKEEGKENVVENEKKRKVKKTTNRVVHLLWDQANEKGKEKGK